MNRLANPRILLAIIALLTAIAVQPGELGSIDTVRRLQVTHWIWTSAPQVAPGDFPGFGIPGRGGKIYAWYGLGQSLLMLPGDIISTALIHTFPPLHNRDELRGLVISYSLSASICVLGVLAAFRLLQLLDFSVRLSTAGALCLLFGTTFLHYTQNMMENNLLLLLMLTGIQWQYEWLSAGSPRKLVAGSIVSGSALLVRLTAILDLAATAIFIFAALWLCSSKGTRLRHVVFCYVKVCAPVYGVFFLLDRAYHYYRFGQCCTNYIQLYGQQQRLMDSSLPPDFPYTTPFWHGFLGPFISPEKSIFLFDPLLLLLVPVVSITWSRLAPALKAYLVSVLLLLIAYAAFHARLWFWGGDVAWGDRYLTTPVQMLALITAPLMCRHRFCFGKPFRQAASVLLGASILVQLSSILLPAWVEFRQLQTLGHPGFVIGMRIKNIGALALEKASGRKPHSNDPVALARGKSFYLYPFILAAEARRLSHSFIAALIGIWLALLAGLACALKELLELPTSNSPEDVGSNMRLGQAVAAHN